MNNLEFMDQESDESDSEEFDSSDEDVTLTEELAASYSNSSDFYQNKSKWGPFPYHLPHETIYKFLTSQGYKWTDKKCKNWEIVSVWEPSGFLNQFADMKRGYSSMDLNLDVLRDLVSECLNPFQLTLENIIAPASKFIVVRIDKDVKKSIDSYCFRTFTFKLECSEFFVSKHFTSVRGTPVTIFGGGKFCKILYETLRRNDIIIIAGTIEHVTFPYGGQRIVLLNHNVENFNVILLRFSFLPSSSDFSIMEKIKPAKESANQYAFDYFFDHRDTLFHHEEQSGYNFRPMAPSSFSKLWTSSTCDYIGMPIKFDDDVKVIYQNLTQKHAPTNAERSGPRAYPQPRISRIQKYPLNQCLQEISICIMSIFFIALICFFANFVSDVLVNGNFSVAHNQSFILKTGTVLQDSVPSIADSNIQDQPENALIAYSKNPIIEFVEYSGSIFLSVLRYLKISCIWAYENMGFQYIWEWLKGPRCCGGQNNMHPYNYKNHHNSYQVIV